MPNFNELINTTDWGSIDSEYSKKEEIKIPSNIQNQDSIPSLFSQQTNKEENSLLTTSNNLTINPKENQKNVNSTVQDNEELEFIAQMFPLVKKELIKELLDKYEDSNTVTNILLDSINLDEQSEKPEIISNNQIPETAFLNIPFTKQAQVQNVKSLREMCNILLCKMDEKFAYYYEIVNDGKKLSEFDLIDTNSVNSDELKLTPDSLSNAGDKFENPMDNLKDFESRNSSDSFYNDDEAIMSFNLESNILKSLIQLFGNEEDEKYVNSKE